MQEMSQTILLEIFYKHVREIINLVASREKVNLGIVLQEAIKLLIFLVVP